MDEQVPRRVVLYTYGRNYESLLIVSLESLIKNYQSSNPLTIWIFEENNSSSPVTDLLPQLPSLNDKPQISIALWARPDWTSQINRNVSNRFPGITLWRLGIPFTFKECDQILYLDTDTLIYGDVNELFDLVDQNVPVAGVPDTFHYLNGAAGIDVAENVGYVNSGVLVFNVQKYNEAWSLNEFLKAVAETDLGGFPDQGLINKQFKGQIQQLPMAYNFQQNNDFLNIERNPPLQNRDRMLLEDADRNVKIKHFLPALKPNSLITPDHDKYYRDWWQMAQTVQKLYGEL
ncbi:glycosyltransferase [Furfurilactobacillus siliginis]|uniref:Glycosyl transferase n=1 Tax=Furfurilactobacillus siliginis TaxID=348151 RepID=A0A0R2KX02_9LACO|nr:glycosyltransferase [Furfurilactobacillus siliginis]KRN94099.1 glycosyl transferase [Furfurilactobacillus siliginis]GEK29471.1 hypothetical protein LSI01_17820 [Furfurilactobacillus siliginis]